MPLVVQYNKRDLPNVLSVEELRGVLSVPDGVEQLDAPAATGQGVFETLKTITKACLKVLGDPALIP